MKLQKVYLTCQAHIHEYCKFSYRVVLFGMHAYLHFTLRTLLLSCLEDAHPFILLQHTILK